MLQLSLPAPINLMLHWKLLHFATNQCAIHIDLVRIVSTYNLSEMPWCDNVCWLCQKSLSCSAFRDLESPVCTCVWCGCMLKNTAGKLFSHSLKCRKGPGRFVPASQLCSCPPPTPRQPPPPGFYDDDD